MAIIAIAAFCEGNSELEKRSLSYSKRLERFAVMSAILAAAIARCKRTIMPVHK